MTSSLMKTMKRAMAAEFSRELSDKVRQNQRRQAARGYWVGSAAPYGYRRQPIKPDGTRRPVLNIGEQNGVQGDRVTLVAGPANETKTIRRIFRERLRGRSHDRIAAGLNTDQIAAPRGGPWRGSSVRAMLANEAYTGACLRGVRRALGKKSAANPDDLVRAENAFPALVSRSDFERVQRTLNIYVKNKSDERLITELAEVYQRHGRLS